MFIARITFTLCIFSLLVSCATHASLPDSDWSVSVSAPTFYPVKVTEGFGVSEQENWESPLHNFTQFMRVTDIENVRKRFPSYKGFGLPIQNYTMIRSRQIQPTNHLPDTIYLHWVSLANTKFYLTKYSIPDAVKRLMEERYAYVRGDGVTIDSCYRTEFVFGLLPNGQAKVFLKGCGELNYLTTLGPDKLLEKDSQGFGVEEYEKKSYMHRIKKRAESEGAVIDPIPWGKVNKVYSDIN